MGYLKDAVQPPKEQNSHREQAPGLRERPSGQQPSLQEKKQANV